MTLASKWNVPKFFCITSQEVKNILHDMDIKNDLIKRSFDGDDKTRQELRNRISKGACAGLSWGL